MKERDNKGWVGVQGFSVIFPQARRCCLSHLTQGACHKRHQGSAWHGWHGAMACAPWCMPLISVWGWSCRHMDSWLRAAQPCKSSNHNILLYHQQVCAQNSWICLSLPCCKSLPKKFVLRLAHGHKMRPSGLKQQQDLVLSLISLLLIATH